MWHQFACTVNEGEIFTSADFFIMVTGRIIYKTFQKIYTCTEAAL